MTATELQQLCTAARKLILETGVFIRTELNKVKTTQIETKSLNSLVSYVDVTAEQQLVAGLAQLLPGCGFIGEEGNYTMMETEYKWIIDPLDGTTNFLHKLPVFSISVALQQRGQTILGIVYEINQDECFYAMKDQGAFLNEQPIRVSQTPKMADTLIATGFPYYDFDRAENHLNMMRYLMKNTRGIRRFGSAAVDLAYVACGRFDAFFEYSLNAWDVAAGAFIVQEAGGRVSDFGLDGNYLFGKEIVAGSEAIFDEFGDLIKTYFEIKTNE